MVRFQLNENRSNELNKLLNSTRQFEAKDEDQLWLRFIYWGESGWNELEGLVSEGTRYLFELNPIEAGPYLHIADGILCICEYGGLETPKQEIKKKILNQIKYLADHDGIPAAELGLDFGWKTRGRCFSFGGYRCSESTDIWEIMQAMKAAQLETYKSQMADHAKKLLECFRANPDQFLQKISCSQVKMTYYQVAIFDMIDAGQFAEASIEFLKKGEGSVLVRIFETLAERHKNDKNWTEEQEWFQSLRGELKNRATEHSPLASAQLAFFFQSHWKFQQNNETIAGDAD